MSYNDNVKELLRNHNIRIGLNSSEEYKADTHESGVAGYYLNAKVPQPLTANQLPAQEYFYRAMSYAETARWVAIWSNPASVTELKEVLEDKRKGIHFATGGSYSRQYITNQSEESVLLEFKSPGLVKKFDKIGVARKNEGGRGGGRVNDMSYGIGYSETIAMQPTRDINNKITEKYTKYKDCEMLVKLREWWQLDEECPMEDKRRLLKVFYFLKQLESIRIVYIKNSR